MPELAAHLDAVEVVFGSRRVLGPISFSIATHEHWALLGPNGSGKTTLLSVLGALRHPTRGVAHVLGERLGAVDLRVLRRRIGSVGQAVADALPYQVRALEIVLTGADSLLAPWWGSFATADERAALSLLAQVHCGHLAEQAFGACSQGERQRILLARSLFGRHELLLLDEPALGVDLPGREALVASLDAMAQDEIAPTTIHVAHTLEELPASTSHVALLRGGSLVKAGPASEVLTDEHLSECYGLPVRVERFGARYMARADGSW